MDKENRKGVTAEAKIDWDHLVKDSEELFRVEYFNCGEY